MVTVLNCNGHGTRSYGGNHVFPPSCFQQQYIFVHRALLESLQCGDPQLSYQDFEGAHSGLTIVSPDSDKSQLQEQFEVCQMSSVENTKRVVGAGDNFTYELSFVVHIPWVFLFIIIEFLKVHYKKDKPCYLSKM